MKGWVLKKLMVDGKCRHRIWENQSWGGALGKVNEKARAERTLKTSSADFFI